MDSIQTTKQTASERPISPSSGQAPRSPEIDCTCARDIGGTRGERANPLDALCGAIPLTPPAGGAEPETPRGGANAYGAFSLEKFATASGLTYTHEDAAGWYNYVAQFTTPNFVRRLKCSHLGIRGDFRWSPFILVNLRFVYSSATQM